MSENNYREQIRKEFGQSGFSLTDRQTDQLLRYYERLTETNKVMNLTAITEFSEVLTKHFVDSASIARVTDLQKVQKVIDIGTGAGFPGVVLKILFPQIEITLLDSLNKRVNFLRSLCAELSLDGVTFLHGRAEDYAHQKEYRERYDLCVSRAVANLATLSEYCIPYTRVGGTFVAYKSARSEEELAQAQFAIRELGGLVLRAEEFSLPGTDIRRTLVVIQKEKKTGGRYPRKAGMPAKEPLYG